MNTKWFIESNTAVRLNRTRKLREVLIPLFFYFSLKYFFLYINSYLPKTLPLPIPCIASLFPSKTLMKFVGVTSHAKKTIMKGKKTQNFHTLPV